MARPLAGTSLRVREIAIQAIQSTSIQRLFVVYFALAALVTVTISAGTFHLFSPHSSAESEVSDKPQYDDLDWAPAGIERALLRLAGAAADRQLGIAEPRELLAREQELRSAVRVVSENPALTRNLGLLPEYTGTFMDLSDLLQDARQLPPNPQSADLLVFRQKTLMLAQQVQTFAEDSQKLEARARISRNLELSGSRKLLAFVLVLLWVVLLMLGWVAVMAIRIQARRIRDYREMVDARQRALDAANAAEIAQATFLGKISHEINSPLQTILTNIQLLESRTEADDRRMVIVRRLCTSVRQLRTQVGDLLGVAEMKGGGSLKLAPENLDVDCCLNETLAVLESAATLKGIYLRLVSKQLGIAYIDGRRLAQILTNLVVNAIRHTDKGGVRVEVEILPEEGMRNLRLVVRDTGPGISAEDQKKLFMPFADTKASRRGSGLGLAIVKGIVDLMQGTIEYSSGAQEGAVFTVVLPLGEAPDERTAIMAESPLQQRKVGGARGTLLLVEDDEGIQETLGELLSDDGYAVTRVGTIADGIAELGCREYDVVVLDLELPDGTGFDLAGAVRTTCNARTPIIAMTAYGELLKKPEARSFFFERLVKPVDQRVLSGVLELALHEASHEISLSLSH